MCDISLKWNTSQKNLKITIFQLENTCNNNIISKQSFVIKKLNIKFSESLKRLIVRA